MSYVVFAGAFGDSPESCAPALYDPNTDSCYTGQYGPLWNTNCASTEYWNGSECVSLPPSSKSETQWRNEADAQVIGPSLVGAALLALLLL